MSLESNTSSSEEKSPFYLKNKQFCENVENFILSKSGKCKGKYNAWSYHLLTSTPIPNNWVIKLKKSTFTSSGNLILSSKRQSLFLSTVWKTNNFKETASPFQIRKTKWCDFIVNRSYKKIKQFKGYSIKTINNNDPLVQNLCSIFNSHFNNNLLWKIHFNGKLLTIENRTNSNFIELTTKLLNLS